MKTLTVGRAIDRLVLLLLLMLAAAGCELERSDEDGEMVGTAGAGGRPLSVSTESASAEPAPATLSRPTASTLAPAQPAGEFSGVSTTHQRVDGNRFVAGQGGLDWNRPLDIPLDGRPLWLVATPLPSGSVWVAVLSDGRVQAFQVEGRDVVPLAILPNRLPPGMPPLLLVNGNQIRLLANPTAAASSLTHPVLLAGEPQRMAFVEADGDLVLWQGEERGRLAVDALPDGRLLQDEEGRLLFLAEPTTRYGHGVLGDDVEAGAILLVETKPDLRLVRRIEIPEPAVVEGIAPIWADLTGDGRREIIVTMSDLEQGGRIVIFNEAGDRIGTGPGMGQPYRWRHQLVVAPLGPGRELELAVVRTPHIGGVVEYYRLSGEGLVSMPLVTGFSSHVIGSRNVDTGLAADADGDGQMELLLPDQAQHSLNGLRRSGQTVEIAWSVPIGERISSNLAAVALPGGQLIIGAGHEGDGLRLWLP